MRSLEIIAEGSYADARLRRPFTGAWWFALTSTEIITVSRWLRLRRALPLAEVRYLHKRAQLLSPSGDGAMLSPWVLIVIEMNDGRCQDVRLISPSLAKFGAKLLAALSGKVLLPGQQPPEPSVYLRQRRKESRVLRLFLLLVGITAIGAGLKGLGLVLLLAVLAFVWWGLGWWYL
jgi:hypothetical protein